MASVAKPGVRSSMMFLGGGDVGTPRFIGRNPAAQAKGEGLFLAAPLSARSGVGRAARRGGAVERHALQATGQRRALRTERSRINPHPGNFRDRPAYSI